MARRGLDSAKARRSFFLKTWHHVAFWAYISSVLVEPLAKYDQARLHLLEHMAGAYGVAKLIFAKQHLRTRSAGLKYNLGMLCMISFREERNHLSPLQ